MTAAVMKSQTNVAVRHLDLAEIGIGDVLAASAVETSLVQVAKKKGLVLIMAKLTSGTATLVAKAEVADPDPADLDFATGTAGVDKLTLALSTTPIYGWLPIDPGSLDSNGVPVAGKAHWGIQITDGGAGSNKAELIILETAGFDPNAGDSYHVACAAFNAVAKYADGSLPLLKGL